METLKKHFASFRLRAEFWRLEYFSRSRAKDFATIKSKRMPVVLVAGIYASGKSLRPLKKFLEQKGWPVSLAPAEKNYAAVPILAQKLEERILAIPAKKVQIVAHSLGGITALVALKTPKVFAKVAQVITLGSPLQGCALGKFAFWELKKNRDFVAPNSKKIQALTANSKINRKFRSLRAHFDPIVFPPEVSILPGAQENRGLPVVGHIALILSLTAWRSVVKRLLK